VNIPGPQGAAGTNGTNGTNGIDSFTYTTAAFFVPALGSSVLVFVDNTEFLPESVAGQFFVSIQGLGYMQVLSVDGLQLTLQNPAPGVLGIANAVPTTLIPPGSLITLAGAIGPTGAAGVSGGAPVGASYICRTADATLTNETALDSLAAGYMKTAGSGGAGVVSTVATVPVGDISGTLPIAKGGTNLTTAPANKIPVGDGTTYLQKEIVGTAPIVVTNSAGNITLSAPSITAPMTREFAYITGSIANLINSGERQLFIGTALGQPAVNAQWNPAAGEYKALNTGYFKITACIHAEGNGAKSNIQIRLKKNGSLINETNLVDLESSASTEKTAPIVLTHIEKVTTSNTDVFELFGYIQDIHNVNILQYSSLAIERIDTL
jgi:hypothetical protein